MDCLRLRGQTAMEFIIGVGFMILVFSVVVLLSIDKISESSRIKTSLDARRVGYSIRDNINMVAQQGRGYYHYFSVPTQIHGGYDYDVQISGSQLEIMWGDDVWTANLIASNITMYCLSRGLNMRNRIYYRDNGLEITCNLPNLKVLGETVKLDGGETQVDVLNDAHVVSGPFTVAVQTNTSEYEQVVESLSAGETLTLSFDTGGWDYAFFNIDSYDAVNESIESDNTFNVTGGGL